MLERKPRSIHGDARSLNRSAPVCIAQNGTATVPRESSAEELRHADRPITVKQSTA